MSHQTNTYTSANVEGTLCISTKALLKNGMRLWGPQKSTTGLL